MVGNSFGTPILVTDGNGIRDLFADASNKHGIGDIDLIRNVNDLLVPEAESRFFWIATTMGNSMLIPSRVREKNKCRV